VTGNLMPRAKNGAVAIANGVGGCPCSEAGVGEANDAPLPAAMNALRIASMLIGPAPDARMTLCTKCNPTPARGGARVLGVCPRIQRSHRGIAFSP
jgi:hypothetical protein